jgi:predicted GIY-YIG superfamily endonuclease
MTNNSRRRNKKQQHVEYIVYSINYLDNIIYIGRTNNIKIRKHQHNNLCFKKLMNKEVYNFIREDTNIKQIDLVIIKIFKTKIESKRYEMLLILQSYFNNYKLYQKIPNISDR